jgi:hypothetical protein
VAPVILLVPLILLVAPVILSPVVKRRQHA